ncbi:MAG TPA: type II toxin-antitoxin system PemK/MazF family toxin [Caulobacteraceae bacterium]|nr:type II toxin-antitoxin system PemK/MazF family toxin [Caulobacteraceae bacterium]
MSEGTYVPEAGDLIWTDFDPRRGREQSGRRPALVISPAALCAASAFVIVCPITRTIRDFGSSVILPEGLPIAGEILTYQVRSIDTLARPILAAGASVPAGVLDEVRAKLAVLCGFSPG